MTLLNLAWRVVAAVTVVVSAPTLYAEVYHPFAQPVAVDPDWQFFAPVDIDLMTEVHPRKRDPHGWFATYDRSYLWVKRPAQEQSGNTGDFGYGNRWSFGYMSEKNKGWLFNFRNIGAPNVYDVTTTERIDRLNANDTGDPNAPVLPPTDRNDPEELYRLYHLQDSLNVFGLTDFQVSRTWRFEPYRYGGRLEPMVGFKYTTLNDTAVNDQYIRTFGPLLTDGTIDTTLLQESLTRNITFTKNQMVGGQFGARYFRQLGRVTASTEFRAFGMANFQTRRYSVTDTVTQYTGSPGTVVAERVFPTPVVYTTSDTFVFGFEARAEAAYQITEGLNIRGGIDVLEFAQGIWRGANPGFGDVFDSNQNVEMAGFTLGLAWNR